MAANLFPIEPQAVASLNGQPAWMVGINGPKASGSRPPLIARWNGTEWVRTKTPFKGYGSLNAVEAFNASSAWAVGARGSYARWPIAARWNGTAWKSVAVPKPAGQLATLVDVALVNANKLWAAGARLDAGLSKPYVLFRSKGRWRGRSPNLAATAQSGLGDITRAPGGRVWTAGWRAPDAAQARAWIAYRTSSGWRATAPASHASGRSAITDMSFRTANDGWAAGFVEQDGGGYLPLLQRWNGTTWSNVSVPWAAGRSVVLTAVEVNAAGSVTVTGTDVAEQRGAVIAVLDQGAWQVATIAEGSNIRAAAMDAAELTQGSVVVGFSEASPFAVASCTATAQPARPAAAPGTSTTSVGEHEHDGTSATIVGPAVAPQGLIAQAVAGTVALDMTAAAGIDLSAPTWGGLVADFNGDDRPDFLVGRHFQAPWARFVNSASGVFTMSDGPLRGDRHDCAAADVDRDGSMDVFCAMGVNKGTSIVPNELLLDVMDGGGEWATNEFGLLDGFGRGRSATFLNLNRDAYPDLFVTSEPSRNDAMSSSNRLYRNVNGDHFTGAPEWGVDVAIGGGCAVGADIDGDGDDDLIVCASEPYNGLEAGPHVFVNNGSRLVDQTAALGLYSGYASDVAVGDVSGDGKPDVVQVDSARLVVHVRQGSGYQQAFQLDTTYGVGIALGDVNADGLMDIYLARRTAGNNGHVLLVNDGDGTSFTAMAIPQPGTGRVSKVLALDYDGNGRTDFITLNGWNIAGPVNLTAFYPE